jgi:hypothetical protein
MSSHGRRGKRWLRLGVILLIILTGCGGLWYILFVRWDCMTVQEAEAMVKKAVPPASPRAHVKQWLDSQLSFRVRFRRLSGIICQARIQIG